MTKPPTGSRITAGSGSVEGVYVSPELIGIIAAAIALGTTMLASVRSIRQELRKEIGSLRGDIGGVRDELRGEIGGVRSEIRSTRSELRSEIGSTRNELRSEIRSTRSELRDEMQAGFKELTARMGNIGDRLSKVEGVIEGVFWSARHQPPDKPREGAA